MLYRSWAPPSDRKLLTLWLVGGVLAMLRFAIITQTPSRITSNWMLLDGVLRKESDDQQRETRPQKSF